MPSCNPSLACLTCPLFLMLSCCPMSAFQSHPWNSLCHSWVGSTASWNHLYLLFKILFGSVHSLFVRVSWQEYWSWLPFPPPVDHVFQKSSLWPTHLGRPNYSMVHSFIDLCKPLHHNKAVIHEGIMLARLCSKSFKLGFSSMGTKNFQMYKLGFEETEETEIKLPTYLGP